MGGCKAELPPGCLASLHLLGDPLRVSSKYRTLPVMHVADARNIDIHTLNFAVKSHRMATYTACSL